MTPIRNVFRHSESYNLEQHSYRCQSAYLKLKHPTFQSHGGGLWAMREKSANSIIQISDVLKKGRTWRKAGINSVPRNRLKQWKSMASQPNIYSRSNVDPAFHKIKYYIRYRICL